MTEGTQQIYITVEAIYLVIAVIIFYLFLKGNLTISNENEKKQKFYEKHKILFYTLYSIGWPALLILICMSYLTKLFKKGNKNDSKKEEK